MDQSLQQQILLETFYNFPICSKPFEKMSETLRVDEAELLKKILDLKSSGHIRQIGPVFNYSALGYQGTLLAAKVQTENIDAFNKLLYSYSGVTHCYVREAEYNVWFTYVYNNEYEFSDFFDTLLMHPSCDWVINLPKKKHYKNAINFKERQEVAQVKTGSKELITELRQVAASLQQDLNISSRPFLSFANQLGVSEDAILQSINDLLKTGYMKRFGSRLNHIKAGLSHNALYVGNVDEEAFEKVSGGITNRWNVSHCYLRYPTIDWPYNLYIMTHGRSREELSNSIKEIRRLTEVKNDAILYTIQELIKRRPVFFREADCRLVA